MSDRTCSVEGCGKPAKGRGWCGMHYWRWQKTGDPGTAEHLPRPRKPLQDRFWSKVNKDGPITNPNLGSCWVWTRVPNRSGYGVFSTGTNVSMLAHRAAWKIHYGTLDDSACVLHKCDNPPCVRPDHLFLGTRQENMIDKISKGRQTRGINNGNAIYTECQVKEIRRLYSLKEGWTIAKLILQFGGTRGGIEKIIRNETWRHLL